MINFMVYICLSSKNEGAVLWDYESPQSTTLSLKGFVTGKKKFNLEGTRSVKNSIEA